MFRDFQEKLNDLCRAGEDAVPALAEALLRMARECGASDLHIECRRDGALVRVRVDGILHPAGVIPPALMLNIVTRMKVLARAKTFDRRAPQDGRIELDEGDRPVFLRASFLPSLHGEKVAIRFPDPALAALELEDLGLRRDDLAALLKILETRQGTLLLTGPVSSGKTTTIYSILKRLLAMNGEGISVATIEDPIEAEIEGVSQTQADPVGGLGYAAGLRMLLRQDTDVFVVGEIRDEETAEMALRAGLIGHMVISTIHSPDTVGVFYRLINMGLEPFMIATSVAAVIAQRLLRKLCPECRRERVLTDAEALVLGAAEQRSVMQAGGCPSCRKTGYSGRTGVFELLSMNDSLREALMRREPAGSLRAMVWSGARPPLARHAAERVLAGETSVEEFSRTLPGLEGGGFDLKKET